MIDHKRRPAARALLWAGIMTATALGATAPAAAQEPAPQAAAQTLEARQHYAIAAGDLGKALDQLAEQNRLQIGYQPQHVTGKTTTALEGEYSLSEALSALLADTGLEARFVSDKAIVVRSIADVEADAGNAPSGTGEAAAVAQAAEVNPDTDPGVAAPGEQTTAKVEVGRQGGIEEIIVTGQKKAERIQDVPIAISAFSMDDLDNQKIEGGFDLLRGVPNVTFSKTNFSGYNFQIRGVGTQAVSATTDPAVAISFNNTTLIVNRLFEQEYLDIERVEVLRGPQGTLYGRNATSGVVNVISQKPKMGIEEGELKFEAGNYGAKRIRGHYNLPLGDGWALRGAYASTERDGYGFNEAAVDPDAASQVSPDVDNRDLWTGRLTLGWEPSPGFRANLMWERFEEDDNRVRTSKQLCHRDPTPEFIGNTPVTQIELIAGGFSQGCNARDPVTGEFRSIYDDSAYGTPNGASLSYVNGFYWAGQFGLPLAGRGVAGDTGLGPSPYSVYDFVLTDAGLQFGASAEPTANAPCEDALIGGFVSFIDLCQPDPYGGREQSRDLRRIYSTIEPQYRAASDIYDFSFDWEWTPELVFSSQTVYAEDDYYATQDYNRYATFPIWNDPGQACTVVPLADLFDLLGADCRTQSRGTYLDGFYSQLAPGGVLCDPQLGCSRSLIVQDLSQATSKQYNQEFRLVSSFDGPVNFSIGANYTRFETFNDYYVFSNAFTYLLHTGVFNSPLQTCPVGTDEQNAGQFCRYVDPNPLSSINGEGHNYFRSANPYQLTSAATFGELYWQATDALKITAGLRLTWDKKVFTPIPSQLLLADYRDFAPEGEAPDADFECGERCGTLGNGINGRGSPASPDIVQEWREPTGRIVVDWKPDLSFTTDTLVYASLSRGYKGGGANPPSVAPPFDAIVSRASGGTTPNTFKAEYINALEIGTKNVLLDGGLTLNASAFYYDYTDYQVSKIVDRRAINENFDATIWGLELESIVAPTPDLLFNVAIGYLRTRLADGEESLDLMDRTDGGNRSFTTPDGRTFDEWMIVKPWVTAASNCVVPVEIMAANIAVNNAGGSFQYPGAFCASGGILGPQGTFKYDYFDEDGELVTVNLQDQFGPNPEHDGRTYNPLTDAPNGGAGFLKDIGGNELPNAPRFTVSLGGQHTWYLPAGWDVTGRVDWYWQDESYGRVYNTNFDRLRDWSNTNLSFWVNQPQWGLRVEAYIKNVFNETPITGTFLNSDDTALTTNVFTLDPRLIGVSITKRF